MYNEFEFTGESFNPNPQKVMFPDFKFAEFKPEICPHCKRPFDENHAMINITELNKQVNVKQ